LEFYFRTPELAKSEGFIIHEPVWQQLARGLEVDLPKWSEQFVEQDFGRDNSAAFPGYSVIFTDTAYKKQDLVLYEVDERSSKLRSSLYETAAIEEPDEVVLEGNWPVIRNPE